MRPRADFQIVAIHGTLRLCQADTRAVASVAWNGEDVTAAVTRALITAGFRAGDPVSVQLVAAIAGQPR